MDKFLVICMLAFLVGCGSDKKEDGKKKEGAALDVPITNVSWNPQEEAKQEEAEQEEADEAAEEEVAEDTVESVLADYNDAMKEFQKAYSEAESRDDKQKVFQDKYPQANDYARRLMKLAKEDPTTEEAAEALQWITQRARGAMSKKAAELLSEHHMDSEVMADIAMTKMREAPSAENQKFLQDLIENSPHERVKGLASYAMVMQISNASRTYDFYQGAVKDAQEKVDAAEKDEDGEVDKVLANSLKQAQRRLDGYVKNLSDDAAKILDGEETESGATLESMFMDVNEQYGEVVLYDRGDNSITVGQKCESTLFEIQHLAIGKVAPDIEGEDLDGEAFKLSDYRGKVVVIDFWGDW